MNDNIITHCSFQSVTATQEKDDHNSYWVIKGTKTKPCGRGEPIECNQIVRIEHLSTKKNLHSHHFTSPLSGLYCLHSLLLLLL